MSPGERAALGRREAPRPRYAATAPGFPPQYYPPFGVPHPNAWLGAPLISMAGRNPPRDNPVSKLAMHAQGAPLIIHNRHDRKKYTTIPEQRNHRPTGQDVHVRHDRCDVPENTRPRNQAQQQQVRPSRNNTRNNNTDAVSVTSDESSGSNNSETMLPRIIKPRKRRKKDRKPNNIVPHDLTSAALELGEVDHCVTNMGSATHGIYDESYCRDVTLPYRLHVKVLDYPDPVPETYRVTALGEALEATRFGLAEAVSPAESAVSSCQCRYCDPVGQIWDANSLAHLLDENTSVDFAPTKLEDSMKVVGPLGKRGGDTMLRRSWSDPSARVPERKANNNDTLSASNLYSLFPLPRRSISSEPKSPLALEISSEIVTSMNGHRDLEIKLFSTLPPASSSDDLSFFDEKSESATKSRSAYPSPELKLNSEVNCDRVVLSDKGAKKSENLDPSCLKTVGVSENSRNICDLALVSA